MNKVQPDVLLLYEHTVREADVACLLKFLAQKEHNVNIEIMQIWNVWHNYPLLSSLRPKLVITPFAYSDNSFAGIIWDLCRVPVLSLNWEQLFYKGNRQAKMPHGTIPIEHVLHSSWSESYAQSLIECGVPRQFIHTTGNPAYCLYDEPYNKYFPNKNEIAQALKLDANKKWLFFPENYNWAFYSLSKLHDFVSASVSYSDIQKMVDYSKTHFHHTMNWCKKAAKDDSLEIIIRPRPMTDSSVFRNAVATTIGVIPKNIHILKDYSIREWLIASDIVVSSYSTSLIEASIASKPHYMLEPIPMPDSLKVEWHKFVPRINTEPEFIELLEQKSFLPKTNPLGDWARSNMMNNGDAIQNTLALIISILDKKVEIPPTIKPYSHLKNSLEPIYIKGKVKLPWQIYPLYRLIAKQWQVRHKSNTPLSPIIQKELLSPTDISLRMEKWARILA